MIQIEQYIKKSGLDLKLLELVKYRVSQINSCAYCLDMHYKDAIHLGEKEQRLHLLAAWRESPFYSEKERAVLAYAEALTNISSQDVDDQLFKTLSVFFTDTEIANITISITQINSWNRICKAFRTPPGSYKTGEF
jgi:AhpD family alkylhydroperoxidase